MHFGLVCPKDAVPEVQKFMLGHPLVGKLGTFLNLTLVKNLSYFRIMDLKCTNIC